MTQTLKAIVQFVAVPVGVPTALPHGLERPAGVPVIPDVIEPGPGGINFTVTADATNVTVTNNGPAAADLDVLVESWHSFERSFGDAALKNLTPQPFITNSAQGMSGLLNRGNTVLVDQVFGDDATGQRQGRPFATVSAALAVAQSGDIVEIGAGVYDLAAGITIPNGVTINGASTASTLLRMLNVVGPTTLVTMGSATELMEIGLQLTSAQHVALIGIDFPGTSAADAFVHSTTLLVDNSGAGAGNSDVIGVRSNGTGVAVTPIDNLNDSDIIVTSTGGGIKRGLLVAGANTFTSSSNVISATGAGGGTFIGAETNDAGATLTVRGGSITGSTADISQTLGSLNIGGGAVLGAANANALGFSVLTAGSLMQFGDSGGLPVGTRYLYPGTDQVSNVPILVHIPFAAVLKSLSVHATTAPGGADTTTFTVQKNNIDTALVATMTGAQDSAHNSSVSTTFAAGDHLSVKVENTGATQNVILNVELY